MIKNILINEIPGCGKSTLLKDVISSFPEKVGFVANEIRVNGIREGFEIETSNGKRKLLAGIKVKSELKVSKYFVDVKGFESILGEVKKFKETDLLYIDEIGEMELYSEKFKEFVEKCFNSENVCVATISKIFNDKFTEKIKKREDIFLVEINAENRLAMNEFVKKLIGKIEKARKYASEKERFKIDGKSAEMKSRHGNRKLVCVRGKWICDCDFFKENGICSHVIALSAIV